MGKKLSLKKSLMLLTLCALTIIGTAGLAYAQQTPDESTEQYVQGTIRIPLSRSCPNGDISGNGVRLRSAPSESASILELINDGEQVCISHSVNSWTYLKRVKTGTWGYVKSEYVYYWD